jgi:S1-C subfamily serine protease
VVALNESITAGDSSAAGGGDSERLTGMIVTNAGIAAGDSGGPLYDANTRIVGINTAAQTSARTGATVAGYSIPINTALSVAEQIVAGVANDPSGAPGLPRRLVGATRHGRHDRRHRERLGGRSRGAGRG